MKDIIFYIFMVYLCIDNVPYVYVIHEYYTTNKILCIFAHSISIRLLCSIHIKHIHNIYKQ